MKRFFTLLALVLATPYLFAQNFTNGNIVIARLGDGTNALNTGALPVSIVEINPTTGAVTKTVNIPSTIAGQRLLINGNPNAGANEGGISLSADGKYIVIGGADVALFDNDTGPDNKSFARINMLGNVDIFSPGVKLGNGYIRATTSTDGSALWFTSAGGTNSYTGYFKWGIIGGAATFSGSASRYIHVIGNQLYSVSGTNQATILSFGTPPTTATPANNGTALAGTNASTVQSAYGFAMLDMDNAISNSIDGNDVLYIVDQTVASPGIVKMAYNTATSNWDYVGKYTSTVPFYGLTARKNGGNVELFTVKNSGENNGVVAIVDANARTAFNTASITETPLASAGTNYVFRSVAFSPYDSTLPLNLTSFTGKAAFNTAKLNWQTTNETNVSHFVLQKSTDGQNFSTVKTIAANNTTTVNRYQAEDTGLLSGTYYYRLNTLDNDGSATLSNMITVTIKTTALSLYPNPAQNYIRINLVTTGKKSAYSIYTTDGKLVKTGSIAPYTTHPTVDISSLKNGAYVLKIDSQQQTFIKR